MAELAPTTQEVADLRVKEKDAHDDGREAKKNFTALVERARMDAMEVERLRKEKDNLLRALEELRTSTEMAR